MARPTGEFSWIVAAVAGWLTVVGSFAVVQNNRFGSWLALSLAAAAISHELAQRKLAHNPENNAMKWTRDIAGVYFAAVCFLTLVVSPSLSYPR